MSMIKNKREKGRIRITTLIEVLKAALMRQGRVAKNEARTT
jgi:hypothetical protein